ncbi:MAG: hypothetical protein ATN34_04515 [Epulopiscium sp. Nele67-Bin002]|nr:MAG: hypothetical protein ATN34_04515 [Epulopiscium sp. Nele67-Bin002]
MIRSIKVLFFMIWHFIVNTKGRRKYRVDDKQLEFEMQKEYSEQIYRIMQSFSKGMVKYSGSKLEVRGIENLPTTSGILYMANHKGMFDPMVVASIIDDPCIFIGKEEIQKMPIIRDWFEAIGSIYLARDDARQSLEVIKKGTQLLKDGQSVVIYPEGTRSKTGDVGEFKAGSFKLAFNSGATIVPMAIKNTEKILESNGLKIKGQTVYVNIGKPIGVVGMSREQQKELPKKVEQYVAQLLEELP